MSDEKKCFLLAVGTMFDEQRNNMMDYLEKRGFVWVDASGSRVVFDISDSMEIINKRREKRGEKVFDTPEQLFAHFQEVAHAIAKKRSWTITMCRHIVDPGLGIILPEDFENREKDLKIFREKELNGIKN